MKKYLVILLADLAAIVIIAHIIFPGTSQNVSLSYRFTFVSGTDSDGEAAGIALADEALGTDTRLVGMRNFSVEGQENLLAKAEYAHVDGIITTGCEDADSLIRDRIGTCWDERVPVVLIGEDIEGTKRIAFVGPDYEAVGRQAQQIMSGNLSDVGKVAVMVTDLRNVSEMKAFAGFRSAAGGDPAWETVQVQILQSGTDRQSVREAIIDALSQEEPPTAIYCVSRASSDYAGDILESEGYSPDDFAIIASGMSERIWQMIQNGRYQCSLVPDEVQEGYRAVELLRDYLESGTKGAASDNTICVEEAGPDFDFESWLLERQGSDSDWEMY